MSSPRFMHTHHFLSHFPFKLGSKNTLRTGYFPPGGRTDEHPSIPPEQLCISLSDPVLVAAEEKLRKIARLKGRERTRCSVGAEMTETFDVREQASRPVVPPSTAPAMTKSYSDKSDYVARNHVGARDVHALCSVTVDHGQETKYPRRWWLMAIPACLRDPSIDDVARSPPSFSLDASLHETNMTLIVDSLATSGDNAGTCASNLAPLASQMFKEELYRRGYLKRSTPHLTAAAYRPEAGTVLTSIRVLGRHQGRITMECLKVMQDPTSSPAEKEHSTYYSCESIPMPSTTAVETPGRLGNRLLSVTTFDLYEFSYITAYTTPSASPETGRGGDISEGATLTPVKPSVHASVVRRGDA